MTRRSFILSLISTYLIKFKKPILRFTHALPFVRTQKCTHPKKLLESISEISKWAG